MIATNKRGDHFESCIRSSENSFEGRHTFRCHLFRKYYYEFVKVIQCNNRLKKFVVSFFINESTKILPTFLNNKRMFPKQGSW